jgi:hypothetical protein
LSRSGLTDNIARKWPRDLRVQLADGSEFSGGGGAYQCLAVPEPVYLHPSSGLFAVANQPEVQTVKYTNINTSTASSDFRLSYSFLVSSCQFCAYVELIRTRKRTYIKGVTAVDPSWLPRLSPALCTDKLLDSPPPRYA